MRGDRWGGFRSVLCPVDFSEPSRLALRYAVQVARRAAGTLTVIYVNDPLLVAAAAAALRDRQLVSRSLKELETFVDGTLAQKSTSRVAIKTAVTLGTPVREILKAAARLRTDLIVMGTQGLTGAQRIVMGSTTAGVLQRTTVPTLAVPVQNVSSRAVPASWPEPRVVGAVDLSSRGRRDAETAAQIAGWFEASLLLVHVVDRVPAPGWFAEDRSAHDRIRVAEAQSRLEELARAVEKYVAVATKVVTGWPADEIAALMAEERSGLLITALRERTGWLGSPRASLSYHVLSHAVSPVLAHPGTWRPR